MYNAFLLWQFLCEYIYFEININLFDQPIVHYILHISKIFLETFLNIIVKNILFFILY